jgi:hypothetical protein
MTASGVGLKVHIAGDCVVIVCSIELLLFGQTQRAGDRVLYEAKFDLHRQRPHPIHPESYQRRMMKDPTRLHGRPENTIDRTRFAHKQRVSRRVP